MAETRDWGRTHPHMEHATPKQNLGLSLRVKRTDNFAVEGRRDEGMLMRKGPWMAEEDEILMEYVKKYGPRDWSSIRSKGLLPRTGKSCRLRWVNKLKPNLKTGCKFSAEEERVVIDLQARFGNKWAKIATYLPGRTDNDVKNFWSTRQKRLARLLQTTSPPKSQNNHGNFPGFPELAGLEEPSIPYHEESVNGEPSKSSFKGNSDDLKMVQLPDLLSPRSLNLEIHAPLIENNPCSELQTQCSYTQLSQPPLDLPLLTEGQDLATGFGDSSFLDAFPCPETLESVDGPHFQTAVPYFQLDGDQRGVKHEDDKIMSPDSFFDDIPIDMFDSLEPLPSSAER